MAVINGATWRAWVSPLVAISFLAVSGSGICMLAHLRGGNIRGLHEAAGILFASAGIVHLVINWRAFIACFRRRVAIAVVATATVLGLILLLTPGHDSGRERFGEGRGPRDGAPAGRVRR